MEGDELAHLVGVVEEIKYPFNTRWMFPSKVGGRPAWLVPENLPSVTCHGCDKSMTFLLQIYAPDNDNKVAFHRSIMVFVCLSCRCLLRAFRVQLPHQNPYYGLESLSTKQVPERDAQLDSATCEECGLLHHGRSLCRALPEYSIEIDELDEIVIGEDPDDGDSDGEMEDELNPETMSAIQHTDTPMDTSESDLFKDFAETALENDASFRVFKKFVDEAPADQILYYSIGGTPVWITEQDQFTSNPPCCEHCNGPRQFEFQIQPQLIYHIMKRLKGYPMDAAPFEWGVVAIYTCVGNCTGDINKPYVEEFVYNQMEPAEWLEFNARKKVDFSKETQGAPKVATSSNRIDEEDDEGEWM